MRSSIALLPSLSARGSKRSSRALVTAGDLLRKLLGWCDVLDLNADDTRTMEEAAADFEEKVLTPALKRD